MNIIEAVEILKQGNAVKRPHWNDTEIRAVQTENGYLLVATGEMLHEDVLAFLSGDYIVVKGDMA